MTGEQTWLAVLVVASAAVVVIALLFGVVIILLRQIDHHAARTYTVGKQIAQNTVALWTLEQTNRDLIAIRDAARAVARAEDRERAPLGAVAEKAQAWLNGSGDEEPRP